MTALMVIEYAAIVCCVLFEGFFSGSEIAIISVDKIKLRHLVSLGSKGAKQAQHMLHQPERFLGTTLVGTNISVVLASVLLTTIFSQMPRFSHNAELYVALILTPFVLLFGEIIPKSIFQQHADTLVPIIARPLHVAFKVFYPVVFLVSTFTNALLAMLGVEKTTQRHSFTRDELKFLVKTAPQADAEEQHRQEMMRRVFEFGDSSVEEILVPLVEVTALEKGTSIADAVHTVQSSGFSRFPIYEDRVDQIIGVVHAFDLLRATADDRQIDPFIRKAYYVPKMMPLVDLVRNMQRHGTQIAIVVDEYGGSLGMVTLEDCLEEIVGDIDDEFDELDGEMYQKLPDGSFRVHARMEIDEINASFGFELPEDGFETLGGFLLSEFRHIPQIGETLEWQGLRFRVEETTARSVLWVNVCPLEEAE
ncbi:hypothetical protein CSB45_08115 [candidate division KSB3 bacterium]|uniref:Hemolysin n=1 Tax=candidate division KSB3 bacterium TaxID=2044937 RepID=A0A2G6E526_9BACT|nr:MAG: hypothetical protein CSB45_08115 [candidate division KSB3 bacterium]PIE29815.1 MAG: hypothetical protein CSA57_07100 [candidate division KSB3 bacterium]